MGDVLAREVAQEILNLLPDELATPTFVVIGIGGAGINVIREVDDQPEVRKLVADTDECFLAFSECTDQLDLGHPLLDGRGTGGHVELGRSAAMLHRNEIARSLKEDIAVLVAGLGRGTGTGAAPVVASIAKEQGLPVLAFLIWPFKEERITTKARQGLAEIRPYCDALLVLDNNAALETSGIDTHWEAAEVVNEMMAQMVERLVTRISLAFPFSMQEEVADFISELPSANEGGAVKAAELSYLPEVLEPVAMDPRGFIEVR